MQMTPAEVAKLLAFITATYPNLDIRDGTVEAWHELLGDLPYEIACAAVKKVLAEQDIPCMPSIGVIRKAAADLTTPRLPSWEEAWGQVVQAIRAYGYYREQEALASLSPPVAALVRRFGWQELCVSEEPDVIRGQFRRAWEAQAAHEREMAVLPARLRQIIESQAKVLALSEPRPVKRVAIPAPESTGGPAVAENAGKVTVLDVARLRKATERRATFTPVPQELIEQLKEAEERGDRDTVMKLLRQIKARQEGDTV